MRKVLAAEFLSLDGVMESPDKWHFPYFNEEMGQAVGADLATVALHIPVPTVANKPA
ncbi:MAG TPA: hypothetical protein VE225_04735 [Rubrobacteraceae bacterium]|nr:hypothetical protein [Rubrobacteraceae bacterium]